MVNSNVFEQTRLLRQQSIERQQDCLERLASLRKTIAMSFYLHLQTQLLERYENEAAALLGAVIRDMKKVSLQETE